MDQISYRGYARSIGFDPIKAPYGILDRMREKDSDTIRGMEENRRAIKQVRDQYAAGLERKQSLESRDRDQNYQFERRLADNRQQAIQTNAQTAIQSELQKGKNAEQIFTSLSKFSSTISKSLTEYQEKKDEADMLNGYMEVAAGNISPQQQLATANAETLLKQSGEATDVIAEGFQSRGGDPMVITSLLTGNKARDYGRLKAYMEMSTAEFSGFAQSRLDELGAATAADRTAAMPQIFSEFLQQTGLFGLKADFMAPNLMKMRQGYNALVADARKSDIVAKSSMMRDDALEDLSRMKSGESLTEAFRAISRSYDKDGTTPIGRARAKELIYEELADTTRYSDQDVQRILSEAVTDQGSSWLDRFGRDYDNLIRKRREDAKSEYSLDQADEQRANKRAEEELIKFVADEWDGDKEKLQAIIDKAETQGISTDRLKAYLAFSNQEQNADFWNQEFRRSYEQGTLFSEDVDQPGVPVEVREQWRNRALEQERNRLDAGIDLETVKKEFSDALKFNLVGESTTKSPHYSVGSATAYAVKLFNQKFKQYSKTMEPSVAAEKARNDVLTAIQNQSTGFKVITSSEANGTQAFYAQFTPGKHSGAPGAVDVISAADQIKQFRTNPAIVNEKVLVSPGILKDIDNRIKAGKPISIPGLYKELAKGSSMSALEIVNAQLQAAGYTTQVQPGFRQTLDNILEDPKLRAIFSQATTQDRLNSVIIASGNAPAVVRTSNAGYQDVVALGNATGFKFPHVMAAMWALESGWGKYHSGKNNVFNIKARQGQGTLMNGSYWRDYASPLESAKDFLNLMTDPRYAPGLAAAQKPRQAIEAIAAGGYAGGEAAYPGKIIRVMQQMGVNVDQPFAAPAPPSRNANNMRPTLAYISGNIGPTSTGAHLDVKQQDNPNTPQDEFAQNFAVNALDNFVVVEDRELGTVPLSRVPITNTFQQHVARGSHGIDYGLYSGTKIYVRNGARVVSRVPTQHGDKVVIQLPDGRRFSFLHGKSV